MTALQDLIAAAPGLSARPDSVVSLMEIIEDPVVGADKLVPIVDHDPGLSAGLLKLCNSPFYNFKRRIGSPREAMVLVGNLTFARLCFTLSLEPVMHRDLPGYDFDLDDLWQHCLVVAYGSAFLIKQMGLAELRDRAFTAGLLHDVGKLVIDQGLEPQDDVRPHKTISLDQERLVTGYDHAVAGAVLLEGWNFPDQLTEAIRWHHEPAAAGPNYRLAQAVHVADQIAKVAVKLRPQSEALQQWVETAFTGVDFNRDAVQRLANTISSKHANILSLAMAPNF